jgi:aspartate oxidase
MVDSTTTPIEIAPTAHYSMGSVWVRPEDHSTDVEGLYAIGEASSGLHRANRLGGNSLTSCSSTARSPVKLQPHTRLHSTPNNVPIRRFPLLVD